MPKKRNRAPEPILPTPLEEHLGEIWDPRGYEGKISEANAMLGQFVEDMNYGRVPAKTLDQVREAVGILGHYSGYPNDAFVMDCFLESPLALSSYKEVARLLPSFMQDMNALIEARVARLLALEHESIATPSRNMKEDDIPF